METRSKHFVGFEIIIPVENVEEDKACGKYDYQNDIRNPVELFVLHDTVSLTSVLLDLCSGVGLDYAQPHLDVLDNVLAEDEGVGHDGAEDEHDAGQHPQRQSSDSLQRCRYKALTLGVTYKTLFIQFYNIRTTGDAENNDIIACQKLMKREMEV